jgi:hypothetical protein
MLLLEAEVDRLPLSEDMQDEERFEQMRAEPRDSMFLLATMRRPGGPEVQVKVRNLSSGGMMVECPASFTRGEEVESDLRGIGAVGGKIAWTTGTRLGVSFDRAIDPALARKPVVGGPQPQLVKASRTMWRPGLR